MIDLDAFVQGYIDAALWTSSIGEDFATKYNAATGEGWDYDTSMADFCFTESSLSPGARMATRAHCAAFIAAASDDVGAYCEAVGPWCVFEDIPAARAGQDFWLTRNDHGAGFWARGLGELGDRLTEAAKSFGEAHLYIGDDDRIYYA